jgi:alpha-tubulin suppressor-like RCC1 family protein
LFGQLARPAFQPWADPTPSAILGLPAISKIACGYETAYALDANGNLFGWGSNGRGQIGDGTQIGREKPALCTLRDIASFFEVNDAVHALDKQGHRYSWGSNFSFLVGNGSLTDRPRPTRLFVK